MMARLSQPIESLIDNAPPDDVFASVDVAIVGSGYGGSVAAACLAGPDRDVVVLERGREYAPGEFPVDLGKVPGHVRFHRADADDAIGYPDALFDLRIGKTMDVLVGSGLGGTSLINANVAARPEHAELSDTSWPHEIRTNPGVLDDWFKKAEDLLGVRTMDGSMPAKHEALSALAQVLKTDCKRAPVAVTFDQGQESDCSKCGNCVTGCNVGAKNTLMMNALPQAHARGAKLYTGATVLSIMPSDKHGWIIRLRRTASDKTPLQDEVFHLGARDVILAAGTLGSTEILLRSRELHQLKLSGELGKNFSGNGDAIAFGFGQDKPVYAIGNPVQPGKHNIGPTITGIVRPTVRYPDGSWKKITIEDAAIPTSLGTLFGELLTTTAFLHRFDNPALPAWYRAHSDVDPLTLPRRAIEHTQALLIMGDDGAAGTLELRPADRGSLDRARIVVSWDDVGQNPALRAAHELLAKHDRGPGLDGGQYVPNPLWRVLPEQAGSVMSGPLPGGRAITVHPLGGCGMGDDVRTGVVNHLGQVFADVENGTGTEVYDGLHVLDGAIIPRALGVNPLLTIAALSWRAADALGQRRRWALLRHRPQKLVPLNAPASVPREPEEVPERVKIHLVFSEQLIGTVTAVPAWLEQLNRGTTRWKDDKGLILGVTMDFPDLEQWLEAGTTTAVDATAKLYVNALPAADTRRLHRVHTPSEDLNARTLVAEGTGTVALFQPVKSGIFTRLWRAAYALWTYTRRRESLIGWFRRTRRRKNDDRTPKVGLLRQARGFLRLAWQFAEYRRLQYRLEFRAADGSFTLEGEKLLGWRMDARRLWDALLTLPFTLTPTSGGDPVSGTLEVDMTYFVKDGTPQVKTSPHLPATIVALSRLGMLFTRAVLQTHFWEFGAPTYPEQPIPRPAGSPSLKVGGGQVEPEMSDLRVPLHKGADEIRLRLTRYRQPNPAAEPVLLIHGLAQGSLIYSTPTLEPNMAAAMWEAGYDVWLLDYRLSNMLPEPVRQGGWSMDDIARYDIPTAIEQVYNACGERPVRIFAHCVGATSVAMAILKGWLKVPGTGRNRVESVAFNAIHPWTIPSPVNEFRARLGSFFRDVVGEDMLDPIPRPVPSAAEVLMDRLAFSVARYAEEDPDHRELPGSGTDATTVCDRMTLLYGRMWGHANLDPRTHAAFPTLVGRGAGDVYRQLYYFALQERLTDAEGENAYLTEANIQANWKGIPTFFLHGEESMVFNPASAERSAIRLHAILNKDAAGRTPVKLLRVPGFGHMDVVFGKDAHAKVYPKLRQFFDHRSASVQPEDELQPEHDIDPRRDFRLTAGPVLRAAWLGDDGLRLRLWVETTDEATSLIDGVEVLEGLEGVVRHERAWMIHTEEPRYRLIDTRLHEKDPLRVKPKLGPMVAEVARRLLRDTEMGEPIGRYELAYLATVPWLNRLRNANSRGLCRDMRFLVGSCRYPGTPFDSDASDAIFGGMLPHITGVAAGAPGVHMLFLVGDQIYADATANILDSRAGRERYGEKYRLAFTSKNASKVLAQVPTHFTIDDHEIADNWSGEEPESSDYKLAMKAAGAFQSSGRRQYPLDPPEKWLYDDLWYALSPRREQCCPTFVMDTRSGRKPRLHRNGRTTQFVQPKQLDSLLNWLTVMSRGDWAAMPKFIVCSVGIAPISRAFAACGPTWRSQDWWPGYPDAMSQVLSTIADERIQHVVFVSGDLHLSAVSRLTLRKKDEKRPPVTAWQVVSSGLYAPLPFANSSPDSYDWNERVRLPANAGYTVDVEAESGLLFAGESHFLRLDAEQTERGWTLAIGAAGADGAFLRPMGRVPEGFAAAGRQWTVNL